MSRRRQWVATGQTVRVKPANRTPAFDPRTSDHLWAVMAMFRVNPAAASDPECTPMLDGENLLNIVGPLCFYCEELYSPGLATRRCKGDASA